MKTITQLQIDQFRSTLTSELGPEVAEQFINDLLSASDGQRETAEQFFFKLGQIWSPIMHAWVDWIKQRATNDPIALVLRDAKSISVIPDTINWKRLYLNRRNCGIVDELSGDEKGEPHPLLHSYLQENGCSPNFNFVDSGCYGSIILELHKRGISCNPLFFFSKNPNIPGFLNEIGLTEKEGEILNDSLEAAFPNTHERPKEFIQRSGKVEVVIQKLDDLSFSFGRAALNGIRSSLLNPASFAQISPFEEAKKLLDLSSAAQNGKFTGILATSSPEWSGKQEFLSKWPEELSWTTELSAR